MSKCLVWPVMILLLLASCTRSKPVEYAWGDYSSTLYKLKKDPCETKLQDHKQMLIQIINESNERSWRVPPGVYAEYGYILVKEGNIEEGFKYLDLESATYPESAIFVQRVKAQNGGGKEQTE